MHEVSERYASDEDVRHIVDDVVAHVLKGVNVTIYGVRLEYDDDGEAMIVVTLRYRDADLVTGSKLNDLTYRLRKKLVERGDDRYPLFDHWFPDKLPIAG